MAKVRVYELARELGMDSKILVEKLKTGGMDIKNYMSTLDEGSVAKAKEVISGSVSEVVEEKRIKPTVIRRRKKRVKAAPEAPVPEPEKISEEKKVEIEERTELEEISKPEPPIVEKEEPEQDVKPLEVEEVKKPVQEPESEEPPPTIPEKETVIDEKSQEIEEKKPAPKTKAKSKKVKKKKGDQPAKIIKRAEEGPLKDAMEKRRVEDPKPIIEKPPQGFRAPPDTANLEITEKKGKSSKKKKDKKKAQGVDVIPKGSIRRRKIEVFV